MSWASTPNLVDFTTFVTNQGVTAAQLPPTSPWLQYALDYGIRVAIQDTSGCMSPWAYVLACYNGSFHWLLRNCPDQAGQTFFQDARTRYNLSLFTAGATVGSGDEGTSQTLAGSAGVRDLSISAMSFIKTPWGVQFLEYQQAYGPNVVGVA